MRLEKHDSSKLKLPFILRGWFITLTILLTLQLPFLCVVSVILIYVRLQKEKEFRRAFMNEDMKDFADIKTKLEEYKKEISNLETTLEFRKKNIEKEINKEKATIDRDLSQKNAKLQELEVIIKSKNYDLEILSTAEKIDKMKEEYALLEDELLMLSYGFYKPKYNFESSDVYKQKLDVMRGEQKRLVKEKKATNHSLDWQIQGDTKRGKEFILDTIKLTLRAFNNECDNIISKVKYNNVEASEKRIHKIFEDLNKLTDMQNVSITRHYLNLKLEELRLKYEYEQKKQEEKEEQQAIKERMREEAIALKEIEKAKEKIEKEEKHFAQAIEKMNTQIESAKDEEKEQLLAKLRELEEQLETAKKNKQDVLYREQNTRAGYVYIISNIGSFGENVYKIGMTRRLEPMDRVKELGDASVPFVFDVHAMIFADDAPALENALHKEFELQRVNKINNKKEFFKVSLDEIKEVVEKNYNKTVEFTKLANAEDYYQTLAIEREQLATQEG